MENFVIGLLITNLVTLTITYRYATKAGILMELIEKSPSICFECGANHQRIAVAAFAHRFTPIKAVIDPGYLRHAQDQE